MIDFRYHIASLMAVFLALGIGMLIGNSFVGLASVESQNRALQRLQEDVAVVRRQAQQSHQENAALKQQLTERDRALRTISPRVVKGVLTGRRVAILLLTSPRRTEIATELAATLTAAGAQVTSTTLLKRNWLPAAPQPRASVLATLQVPRGEDEEVRANEALSRALVSGNWDSALHKVAALSPGVILDGVYTVPAGSVVIVDSTEEPNEALEAQSENSLESVVTDTLREAGIKLVAAEAETAAVSMVSFFQNQKIPTVDNIDTAVGQVACVMALAVGSGNYGTKTTADRLLPDMPLTPSAPAPAPPPAASTSAPPRVTP